MLTWNQFLVWPFVHKCDVFLESVLTLMSCKYFCVSRLLLNCAAPRRHINGPMIGQCSRQTIQDTDKTKKVRDKTRYLTCVGDLASLNIKATIFSHIQVKVDADALKIIIYYFRLHVKPPKRDIMSKRSLVIKN